MVVPLLLQFDKDGSLDIHIQHASPGKDKDSNWLPAPEGNFDRVLRAYWPMLEVLTGGWNPPAVKRANHACYSIGLRGGFVITKYWKYKKLS